MSAKEIVSDLAIDGISINVITKNKFIRYSIQQKFGHFPSSPTTVMGMIHQDFDEKKSVMKAEIAKKIEKGVKFSITHDEYTSSRRRRYIGVNIHESEYMKTYKTGLIRINGSCNAEDLLDKITDHLRSFGLCLFKDIVGSTQDGAAINKKFMRMTDLIQQFCFNHAIHLGVCDTLYKKSKEVPQPVVQFDEDDDEDEDEDEDDYEDNFCLENIEGEQAIHYPEVLKVARKVVKFIKLSSVRNQIFQEKVLAEFGNEIELHLDVKHRWNSMFKMTEPLLKTKKCLFETFAELNSLELINKLDFDALLSLQNALIPVKLAVEYLSKENSTLSTADTVMEFMLNKLNNLNTAIADSFYTNLKKRIYERRNEEVMQLFKCLKDPSYTPSKTTLTFAGQLAHRLFGFASNDENEMTPSASIEEIPKTLNEELNEILSKDDSVTTINNDQFKCLKQEFLLFRNTFKRTENLEKIYRALNSIKPTSTDVERVFSVSSNFCTKIRSRLSDKSLNSLVFLKYFYNKN